MANLRHGFPPCKPTSVAEPTTSTDGSGKRARIKAAKDELLRRAMQAGLTYKQAAQVLRWTLAAQRVVAAVPGLRDSALAKLDERTEAMVMRGRSVVRRAA